MDIRSTEAQAYGRDQVHDQAGEGGFASRPVRRPELAPEGQGNALLRKFLVDTGLCEGLENIHIPVTPRDAVRCLRL